MRADKQLISMPLIKDISRQIALYLEVFPYEYDRLRPLNEQILECSGDMMSRKTMAGHITASAFILNPARDAALLIQHKALKQWLQPGGHYEGDKTLADAALREASEETGVEKLRLLPVHGELYLPLDIDTHPIPARPSKDEGPHRHHDFTYVCQASANDIPSLQTSEVDDARFIPLREIEKFTNLRLSLLASKAMRLFPSGS